MAKAWRIAMAIATIVFAFASPASAQDEDGGGARYPAYSPADPATNQLAVDPPFIVRTGTDLDARVTVPIRISDKGPYAFVVDTGSQRTVISRELANRLALVADATVRVMSMTGISDVDTVIVPHLSFGTTQIRDIQAPVFAGEHLGAHGLLGLDGLQSKRLILNFRTGRMDIGPSRRKKSSDQADAIVVTARSKLGQLILLDSRADGQRVNVILDTGAEYSVGNAALLRKLTRKRKNSFTGAATMTSVTGDTLVGQWGMIDEVKMGGLTMTDLPVVFAEAAPFAELGLSEKPALLLGINALRVFARVAIDFGAKSVDFLLPDQGALDAQQLAALQP